MLENRYMLPASDKSYLQIDYNQYVYEISKFPNRNAKLGFAAMQILKRFLLSDATSSYDVFNYLKSKGKPTMAYKNVNRWVRKLLSLNLIEKSQTESRYGAKYYRLTTGGIFHILYEFKDLVVEDGNNQRFFKIYHNNIIFKTLLYPYFDLETVLQRSTELLEYLGRCCEVTDKALRRLKQEKPHEHELLAVWNYTPGKADFVLLDALQSDFDIKWLEKQDVKIEKFDNGNAMKILSGNNFLFIRLDKKKNNAIMDIDDKTYEFNVLDSQHDGPLLVYNKKTVFERTVEEIANRISSMVTLLVQYNS
jgi:hypothetical protein